ncbi:hypothetical protein J2X14_000554 [Pantoea alhagi]|nr:hypothetical protein [Pantoea alhagi]
MRIFLAICAVYCPRIRKNNFLFDYDQKNSQHVIREPVRNPSPLFPCVTSCLQLRLIQRILLRPNC